MTYLRITGRRGQRSGGLYAETVFTPLNETSSKAGGSVIIS